MPSAGVLLERVQRAVTAEARLLGAAERQGDVARVPAVDPQPGRSAACATRGGAAHVRRPQTRRQYVNVSLAMRTASSSFVKPITPQHRSENFLARQVCVVSSGETPSAPHHSSRSPAQTLAAKRQRRASLRAVSSSEHGFIWRSLTIATATLAGSSDRPARTRRFARRDQELVFIESPQEPRRGVADFAMVKKCPTRDSAARPDPRVREAICGLLPPSSSARVQMAFAAMLISLRQTSRAGKGDRSTHGRQRWQPGRRNRNDVRTPGARASSASTQLSAGRR